MTRTTIPEAEVVKVIHIHVDRLWEDPYYHHPAQDWFIMVISDFNTFKKFLKMSRATIIIEGNSIRNRKKSERRPWNWDFA